MLCYSLPKRRKALTDSPNGGPMEVCQTITWEKPCTSSMIKVAQARIKVYNLWINLAQIVLYALCKGSIALWENIWCNSKYFSTKYLQNESLDDTGFHNLYFIKKLNVEKPLLSRFMQVQCKAHAHGRAEYTETRRQYIGHHTGSGCHIYSNSRSHVEACHDFFSFMNWRRSELQSRLHSLTWESYYHLTKHCRNTSVWLDLKSSLIF